jgi:competence protein ComEC
MLDRHVDVSADVLKVPHHGSAYSEPAFLAAVHASVAVISVGLHNDYGHPAPSLLAALDGLGLPVRRTDHDGDVAVTGRPGSINTIVRGKRASSVGMGAPAAAVARAPSQVDDRMNTCLPVRSESTSCPIRSRPWSCSSATRSCSSGAPSARSPPSYGVPTRRPT